ncbi:MAG: MOSC domain-containing protein, partial [Pseudomonadota bacterium]
LRRNERQWSGISADELAQISQVLNLNRALEAEDLGANLCVSGIENFSRLPRGTRLSFSSGAVLAIEEYNPPCMEMGEKLASLYATEQGESFSPRDFVMAARRSRGVVGVVEVPGVIAQDDVVLIERPWDPFANADA